MSTHEALVNRGLPIRPPGDRGGARARFACGFFGGVSGAFGFFGGVSGGRSRFDGRARFFGVAGGARARARAPPFKSSSRAAFRRFIASVASAGVTTDPSTLSGWNRRDKSR